jgi:hypothetical protein
MRVGFVDHVGSVNREIENIAIPLGTRTAVVHNAHRGHQNQITDAKKLDLQRQSTLTQCKTRKSYFNLCRTEMDFDLFPPWSVNFFNLWEF